MKTIDVLSCADLAPFVVDRLLGAMTNTAIDLAESMGLTSDLSEPDMPLPTDAELAIALRQPVSMAAVFADVLRYAEIELPAWLLGALNAQPAA